MCEVSEDESSDVWNETADNGVEKAHCDSVTRQVLNGITISHYHHK
jgi:hypothetical protein